MLSAEIVRSEGWGEFADDLSALKSLRKNVAHDVCLLFSVVGPILLISLLYTI